MWKRIEFGPLENPPARLVSGDVCCYARDFTSGGGFSASETNNLISNFKKPVERRGKSEWQYKERAIRQFANELRTLLTGLSESTFIAHIPSSKKPDDPDYDNRLECVIRLVAQSRPHLVVTSPVRRRKSMRAAHTAGENRPSPSEVYDSLEWVGLPDQSTPLIFLDDVITAGTTFKQCQRLVVENSPQTAIVGVFWARTIWVNDTD